MSDYTVAMGGRSCGKEKLKNETNQKIINMLMTYEPLNALILGLWTDFVHGAPEDKPFQRMKDFEMRIKEAKK